MRLRLLMCVSLFWCLGVMLNLPGEMFPQRLYVFLFSGFMLPAIAIHVEGMAKYSMSLFGLLYMSQVRLEKIKKRFLIVCWWYRIWVFWGVVGMTIVNKMWIAVLIGVPSALYLASYLITFWSLRWHLLSKIPDAVSREGKKGPLRRSFWFHFWISTFFVFTLFYKGLLFIHFPMNQELAPTMWDSEFGLVFCIGFQACCAVLTYYTHEGWSLPRPAPVHSLAEIDSANAGTVTMNEDTDSVTHVLQEPKDVIRVFGLTRVSEESAAEAFSKSCLHQTSRRNSEGSFVSPPVASYKSGTRTPSGTRRSPEPFRRMEYDRSAAKGFARSHSFDSIKDSIKFHSVPSVKDDESSLHALESNQNQLASLVSAMFQIMPPSHQRSVGSEKHLKVIDIVCLCLLAFVACQETLSSCFPPQLGIYIYIFYLDAPKNT
eukprot:g73641.t1